MEIEKTSAQTESNDFADLESPNTTATSGATTIGELPIERLRAMCLFLIGQMKMKADQSNGASACNNNSEETNPFCPQIWGKFLKRQQATFPGQQDSTCGNPADQRIFTPQEMVLIFRHQILPNLCEILTRGGGQIDYRLLLLLQSKLSGYSSSSSNQQQSKNDDQSREEEKDNEKSSDEEEEEESEDLRIIDSEPESSSPTVSWRENMPAHPKILQLNKKIEELQSNYANLLEQRRQIQKAAEISDRAFFQLTLEAKKKNLMLKHLALCRKAELALKKCRQLGRLGTDVNQRAENSDSPQISNEKSTNTYECTDFRSLRADLAKQQMVYVLQERVAKLKSEIGQIRNEVCEDQEIFYDINRS